jgi:hypothetical protein
VDTKKLVVFSNTHCYILNRANYNQVMAVGHKDSTNGFYRFGGNFQANLVQRKDRQRLWYIRYGYLSFSELNHLSKYRRVTRLPMIDPYHEVCEHCLVGR